MQHSFSSPGVHLIPFENALSPLLPVVLGNATYLERAETLARTDEILRSSGVENEFVAQCLRRFHAATKRGKEPTLRQVERRQIQSRQALRTMVLKSLLQETYEGLALQLAQAPLLRKFCLCDNGFADPVRVPSKSALQRYAQWAPHEEIRAMIDDLTRAATSPEPSASAAVGLETPLELGVVFIDSTCLPANIHFPVDWVLFRDATRSLMARIHWIREQGLKNRMEEPESFVSRINSLCMEMTQVSKSFVADSKNKRKAVLRKMKKVLNTVERHARSYRDLLADNWQEAGISSGNAHVVLQDMDNILSQLPAAKKQAHDRIIGERQVPNEDKILSFYEPDIHVIVRGKASGEVEFGNGLIIAEQVDGLIVDYKLMRETPPADSVALKDCVARIADLGCGEIFGVVTDRGFASQANSQFLKERGIFDGTCPRNPRELKRRRAQDELFVAYQKRRAQTEARIGILKNVYIGERCRAKGFESREAQVDWAVLAHNLRLIARLSLSQEKARAKEEAAAKAALAQAA